MALKSAPIYKVFMKSGYFPKTGSYICIDTEMHIIVIDLQSQVITFVCID